MTTLTDIGLEAMARMIAGFGPPAAFIYLGTGSGSSAESPSSTALDAENTLYGSQRAAATCSFIAPGFMRWSRLIQFTGDVTVQEVGIFNSSGAGAGNMLLRLVLPAPINYVSSDEVEIIITHGMTR